MGITPTTAPRPAAKDAASPAPAAKKPLAVFRYENVSAAVFIDRQQEGKRPLYNISLSRSYRDDAGAWKSTHTLWPSDLLAAAEALRSCYAFVHEGQSDDASAA